MQEPSSSVLDTGNCTKVTSSEQKNGWHLISYLSKSNPTGPFYNREYRL